MIFYILFYYFKPSSSFLYIRQLANITFIQKIRDTQNTNTLQFIIYYVLL